MALLPSRCAAHPPACPCHSRALMPPFLSRFADLVRSMSYNSEKLHCRTQKGIIKLFNVGDGQDLPPQPDLGLSLIAMQRAWLLPFCVACIVACRCRNVRTRTMQRTLQRTWEEARAGKGRGKAGQRERTRVQRENRETSRRDETSRHVTYHATEF